MSEVIEKGKLAKKASYQIGTCTTKEKNEALLKIANGLRENEEAILAANRLDIQAGKEKGLSASLLDRVELNQQRIADIADAILQIIDLTDPIGEVLETIEKDNGLKIINTRVPIGVVGMIYEARPNVTVDAATLAVKTGNAIILRGSSSAIHSNLAIVKVIHEALEDSAVIPDAIQLIEDTSRETASELFRLNAYLDVLIPRGGKNLIDTVVRESRVPVIETGAGNCHAYIDDTANPEMAKEITLNAKLQRPSVCNSIESLLIQSDWFEQHGNDLIASLMEQGVTVHGDARVVEKIPFVQEAAEEDWRTEYLGLEISVKTVADVHEAIDHINTYGTKHSEAIITETAAHAETFKQKVDATTVYHNASTRFTDGFEFGFGAEIGISTQKLHARGPMGLKALTSNKFIVSGEGQIRE
ncbi:MULTISPECIES: glutamate-5-semialdehyde dehydrogenase [Oceanobacillus]|uniref:Gamma-glutamyl phosphate reductase n=1 Tax=Oceanobacillus aidingensis TaxID=645964 RepID=A0ABV9K412_9BACI|nr:glutamate-5-semialdehyde dehydrogenase [Oceanobacillus oncorhynchi]MDM8099609.1 glutamate-5-semialdehyde dehydrogenase [Oceanobacillus oncorhynchi]UUI41938.1 glutamate-5-semialdehyde dehydrogenase [Oceanobacillus oncorhynchi]